MNIDWSKAPEGATHYYTRGSTPWRDLSGENWKWWADGKWNADNAVHSSVDRSSQGFLERRCAELIPRPADPILQTRQEIIDLAAKRCGISGDSIRQLATVLAAEGYRKFEIVEEDV